MRAGAACVAAGRRGDARWLTGQAQGRRCPEASGTLTPREPGLQMLAGDASDASPAPRPGVRSVVLATWLPRGPSGHLGEASQLRAGGGEDGTATSRSRLRYGHAARFPRRCGVCGRAPRTRPGPCPHPQGSVLLCSPRQAPAWVSVSPRGPVASACWWRESRLRALLTTGAQTGEDQARAQCSQGFWGAGQELRDPPGGPWV